MNKHKPYMMAYYMAITPEFRAILDKWPGYRRLERRRELFPEYPDNLYQVFRECPSIPSESH